MGWQACTNGSGLREWSKKARLRVGERQGIGVKDGTGLKDRMKEGRIDRHRQGLPWISVNQGWLSSFF
jgi:hypothetical protein